MTQVQLPIADTLDFGVGSKVLFNDRPVEVCFVGNGKNRQITWRTPGEKDPIKQWVTTDQLQPYETSPLPANVFRVGDRVQSKQQVGLTDGVIFNVIAVNGDILSLEGIGRDGKPIKTHFSKAVDFELVSPDKWAAWEKVLQPPAEPAASFAVGDTVTLTAKFAKSAGLSAETHYRVSSINKHGLLSLSGAGMDVPLISPEKVELVRLAESDHHWQVGDHASIKPEVAAKLGLDSNFVYTVERITSQGFISLKGISNPARFVPEELVFEEVVAAKDEPTPAQKAQPRNNPNVGVGKLKAGDCVKTRRGRIGIVTTGESHDRLVRVDSGKFTTAHYVETLELLPPETTVESEWQSPADPVPNMLKVHTVGYRRDEQGAIDRGKDIARHLYQRYLEETAGGLLPVKGWDGKMNLYIDDAYRVHTAIFTDTKMLDYRVEVDEDADGQRALFVESWMLSVDAISRIETLTAQRDKLLTDPVRLQVKELEVKLAAAEAARETAEKRAIQHEAAMLAKVEAAQAEAEKWRDELKALELGQPVTPPPAPTVLKTEIKTLVQPLRGDRRENSDQEFAEHLNAGWEVLHLNTVSVVVDGFDYPERHITLKRLVQLPAFPPQPTARAAADLAEEFVAALEDDEPVVDPADLDTEIEEEFDPVVPISQFAITPEERDALDKLHAPAKQVIILPQVRPSALDRVAPNFAQTNPLGEVIRREGVDALHEAQNAQTLAAMRAAYNNALQRTRSYPLQLTAEVE